MKEDKIACDLLRAESEEPSLQPRMRFDPARSPFSCYSVYEDAALLAEVRLGCTGIDTRAGKRLGHAKRRGNRALGRALVQAAWATRRTKTYLGAQFQRLARTRGAKRAAVAVGHSILVIAYHILKDGVTYQDLGHRYFEERSAEARQRWLVRQLQAYDLEVTLTPKPEAA